MWLFFFLNIVFSGTTHHHLSSWVQARLIPSLAVLYMLSSWLPQAQTNGTKGLEERDGETKSLEGGAVKFPDLGSALTDRRQDGENLRFPTLVKNKKRRSRLPMCRRCRIWESYSEYGKYSERSSVGGWESGTDVTGDDGSALPACQGDASANNASHPKWAPHFLYSLI